LPGSLNGLPLVVASMELLLSDSPLERDYACHAPAGNDLRPSERIRKSITSSRTRDDLDQSIARPDRL